MRRDISDWWALLLGTGRFSRQGDAAMLQGLRVRLTLWYCGVLASALILFGLALYFGTQYSLFLPVEQAVIHAADAHAGMWLHDRSPANACPPGRQPPRQNPPPPGLVSPTDEIIVCFDAKGALLSNQVFPASLVSNDLVKTALQTGQTPPPTIVNCEPSGRFFRYAEIVPRPTGRGLLGVIVVGESLLVQDNVLSLLLMLLLSVGGVALLAAGLGGLFLAQRALAPARLAWERQQRFIGDASHELRTPLTLLRADAEVLLRSREHMGAEDEALLEDMVQETNHMAKLLNNMLTLARLDHRTTHQEYEVVNLSEVAHASVRRVHALASQMEVAIQVATDEYTVVIGDSAQLEQAVIALLDNAIKYSHRGGDVALRTTAQGRSAVLEVADTGIGIAAEHLSHLGERFYRVDKARSRQAGGTGLGLSIVRGIAAAHGGTLALKSVPGQGTTATITLPLAHTSSAEGAIT